MYFLAAAASSAPTTADKLKDIPSEFWWKLALGIVAIVVVVIVLRKVAKMNKLILGMGVFLFLTFLGFNWIYERNEPAWATPAVQWLAGFFPTKGRQL